MQRIPTVRVYKTKNVCTRCGKPSKALLVMMGNHCYLCRLCHKLWHDEYYSKMSKPVDMKQYNEFLERFMRGEKIKEPFIFR